MRKTQDLARPRSPGQARVANRRRAARYRARPGAAESPPGLAGVVAAESPAGLAQGAGVGAAESPAGAATLARVGAAEAGGVLAKPAQAAPAAALAAGGAAEGGAAVEAGNFVQAALAAALAAGGSPAEAGGGAVEAGSFAQAASAAALAAEGGFAQGSAAALAAQSLATQAMAAWGKVNATMQVIAIVAVGIPLQGPPDSLAAIAAAQWIPLSTFFFWQPESVTGSQEPKAPETGPTLGASYGGNTLEAVEDRVTIPDEIPFSLDSFELDIPPSPPPSPLDFDECDIDLWS
ncbi:spidroin-1-like [Selaginella moellendorffii]|uniref:spidroin-1-like n=1 Tax=Selaginella moellendorffii TaxID=88036 RepID=UPI000D1C53E6|nr:spidroin-1-like [Selaginella moellendorffii]|eukprot:XP_024541032.1 spidroin-1-like [Selaginella moellendorffii]